MLKNNQIFRRTGINRVCRAGINLVIILTILSCLAPANMAGADDCEDAGKWYDRGLDLSDNSEKEASYYKRAIELCPDFFQAHNRLGELYKNRGEYDLAIRAFNEATRMLLYAEPHNNLGDIYRMLGKYDLAAEEFITAIRIDPGSRGAQNQLKYVYKQLGKYDYVLEDQPDLIPISIFTRIPGITLPKGSILVDFQYKYWEQESDLTEDLFTGRVPPMLYSPSKRETDVHAWILGIRYGLTNDFTIGLIPKFFSKQAHIPIQQSEIDAEPQVTGFGDTVLLTKYHLWGRRKTHIAGFLLVSVPTGDENAEDKDQGLACRIPLGSGTYHFTPGIAFTKVEESLAINADISYMITDGNRAADEFHCDLAFLFPCFRNLISSIEVNYRWRGSCRRCQTYRTWGQPPTVGSQPGMIQETYETTLMEKGGHTLFLSPGLQVSLPNGFKAELGVKIPVIKPSDKIAWVEKAVFHVGLTKYFF